MYWERERSLHERANMVNPAINKGIDIATKNIAISLLEVLDDETIAIKTELEINEVRKLRLENTK